MSTTTTIDRGDYTEVREGEPTWQNPTEWLSIRYDPKPGTPAANRATLEQRALNALALNDTYRALANPTNAQVVAQVDLLTRECSGIIRLLLARLDTTTGT